MSSSKVFFKFGRCCHCVRRIKWITLEVKRAVRKILNSFIICFQPSSLVFFGEMFIAFLLSAILCMVLLIKFAFLACDSSIVSVFSIFLSPASIFEPFFIDISIHIPKGKDEYGFPVRDLTNKFFVTCSSIALVKLRISVQNSTSHLS